MWLRLSLQYGIPVRELQERISSHEFAELCAVDQYYHPLDDSWRQTGMVVCSFAGRKHSKPEDFVPVRKLHREYTREMADRDIETMLLAFRAQTKTMTEPR